MAVPLRPNNIQTQPSNFGTKALPCPFSYSAEQFEEEISNTTVEIRLLNVLQKPMW
jgi:hypothetical protein